MGIEFKVNSLEEMCDVMSGNIVPKRTDYQEYVDKYARDHRISKEEAAKHSLVKEVANYYREKKKDVIASDHERKICDTR